MKMIQLKMRHVSLSEGGSWFESEKKPISAGGLELDEWSGDSFIWLNVNYITMAVPFDTGFRLTLANGSGLGDHQFLDVNFDNDEEAMAQFKRNLGIA